MTQATKKAIRECVRSLESDIIPFLSKPSTARDDADDALRLLKGILSDEIAEVD
jgi:hypothetical protein